MEGQDIKRSESKLEERKKSNLKDLKEQIFAKITGILYSYNIDIIKRSLYFFIISCFTFLRHTAIIKNVSLYESFE